MKYRGCWNGSRMARVQAEPWLQGQGRSAGLAAVPKVLQWEAALLQEVTEQWAASGELSSF